MISATSPQPSPPFPGGEGEAKRRERWLTIGVVQWPWFVYERQSGSPNGYLMIWRGRVDWCQPCEFRRLEHLFWAVERRLHLCGLQWVAFASEVPRRDLKVTLRVLVRRTRMKGDDA